MRVAVNALPLAHLMTGSGRYTSRLLAELPAAAPSVEVLSFGPAGGGHLPWLPAPTPFDRLNARGGDLAKLWLEQFALPRAAHVIGADVLHYPYFAAPALGWVGTRETRPSLVVTVHDLIPLLLPEYRASARVRLYTALVAAATRRATLVLTVSEASRQDILRHLKIPNDLIRVIPNAVDGSFRPDLPAERLANARQAYGLPDKYILYLGGFDRRKNVPRLLEAYARARAAGLRTPLVLAGGIPKPGPLFPDVIAEIARLSLAENVVLPGWIADADQPSVFAAASAFVFPSLYEGFGIPPLEAMACGTPVVCSNRSSLPEVVGDAALLCDPTDVEAIARRLIEVDRDPALRDSLRERGLARAAGYNWRSTARATAAAYADSLR